MKNTVERTVVCAVPNQHRPNPLPRFRPGFSYASERGCGAAVEPAGMTCGTIWASLGSCSSLNILPISFDYGEGGETAILLYLEI